VGCDAERDMDICRPKDHKRWSRPSFCGLSGYEPKIWHPGLLGRASCTIRAVPGSNPGHFTTKSCLFSSVRTPDMPKQKCCLFSSVRTPDITQQQKPASRLLPCTPAPFLSFAASTFLRKRTVDARGVRGIWIYAAQRTTNVGRDHPFVVCQVMSQKYGILVYLAEPRAQFERSLVRTSDMPKQKCCLFSSVRTPDITQQQNQLPGCFLVLQHHFFLSLPRPSLEKKGQSMQGG